MLRRFLDYETRRKLKADQLQMAIALLNCQSEEARKSISNIWKELVQLEFGQDVEIKSTEAELEQRWMEEFERMKQAEVRLVRKDGGLSVEGLKDIVE